MPKTIVHALEAIQVEEEHRVALGRSARSQNALMKTVDKKRSIGEPRKRITQSIALELFFGRPPTRDVGLRTRDPDGLAVRARNRHSAREHPSKLPISMTHSILNAQKLGLTGREPLERALEARHGRPVRLEPVPLRPLLERAWAREAEGRADRADERDDADQPGMGERIETEPLDAKRQARQLARLRVGFGDAGRRMQRESPFVCDSARRLREGALNSDRANLTVLPRASSASALTPPAGAARASSLTCGKREMMQ